MIRSHRLAFVARIVVEFACALFYKLFVVGIVVSFVDCGSGVLAFRFFALFFCGFVVSLIHNVNI